MRRAAAIDRWRGRIPVFTSVFHVSSCQVDWHGGINLPGNPKDGRAGDAKEGFDWGGC